MRSSTLWTVVLLAGALLWSAEALGQDPVCPVAPAFSGQLCASLQDAQCATAAADETCWPSTVIVGQAGVPSAESCGCFSGEGCGPIEVIPTAIPEDYILTCVNACLGDGGPCGIVINQVPTGQPQINTFQLEPGDVVQCICTEVPPPVCPQPPGTTFCEGFEFDCLSLDFTTQCRPQLVRVNPQGLPEPESCSCYAPDGNCGPVQVEGTLLSCSGDCPAIASCQVQVNFNSTGLTEIDSTSLPPGALVSCGCSDLPPSLEACCMPESALTCFLITVQECLQFGGVPQGPGSKCLGLEACCLPGGDCQFIDRLCCLNEGGTPQGPDGMCGGQGACCLDIDDGPLQYDTCFQADQVCCESGGGVFQGVGSTCDSEACCLPGGFCQNTDPECCAASGGLPLGPGSSCIGGPQCPVEGACCLDFDDGPLQYDTCTITTPQECLISGGLFQGPNSTCDIQACCLPGPFCQDADVECCEASGGIPQGPTSTCDALPTCPVGGACCLDIDDGPLQYDTCVTTTQQECEAGGGFFQGFNSTCDLQACCLPGGFCQETDADCCKASGGLPLGSGSSCGGIPQCPVQGACCLDIDDGPLQYDTCTITTQQECLAGGGLFQGPDSSCDIQACCLPDGLCQETDAECCEESGGVPLGSGSACNGIPQCPVQGACCFDIDDGPLAYDTCVIIDELECLAGGGLFQGPNSTCDIQACCLPTGFCQETDAECCELSGGTPIGPGTECSFVKCEPLLGACCFDEDNDGIAESCAVVDPLLCDELSGFFHGPGTTCLGVGACCFGITGGSCVEMDRICCDLLSGNSFLGCGSQCLGDTNADGFDDRCTCPADLNGDGLINAADLALLLGSWGLCGCCPADLTLDGTVNAADLALLLGSWGRCP